MSISVGNFLTNKVYPVTLPSLKFEIVDYCVDMSYSSHVNPKINEATLHKYDSNIDAYTIRKTIGSDLTEIVIDPIDYYPQGCLGTDVDPSTRPCG